MSWLLVHGVLQQTMFAVRQAHTTATASHLVIAGVNKAGTTSLFTSLAGHPAISGSSVKETRFFTPARYGRPVPSADHYAEYFRDAHSAAIRLEATPSYIYGGAALAAELRLALANPRVIMVLREPVSRAISFFKYQKARLRVPPEMTLAQYLAIADRLTLADFDDPENERYFAFLGGCYADFLPGWYETLGADNVHIVYFDELTSDPSSVLRGIASWLDIDPNAFDTTVLSSENRTMGFRSRAFQRLALLGNDRFERFLRRHLGLKRRMRALYYKINGRPLDGDVPESLREELRARYEQPNARLATVLEEAHAPLPRWLASTR